ncbi:MAG: hypothetical protein ACP5NW_04550 [Candidatus Woesearchaeota archaeon]
MGRAFNMNIVAYIDNVHHSDEHPTLYSKNKKNYYSLEHIQKLSRAIEYAKTFENCRVNPENEVIPGFLKRLPKVNCILYINENIESLLAGHAIMNSNSKQIERTIQKRDISPEEHYFIRLNDSGNILQLETVAEREKRIEKEILAKFFSHSDHLVNKERYFGSNSSRPLALETPDKKYEDCIY